MKIICIGRNYSEHAREMGVPVTEKPVFFMKPDTAIVTGNKPIFYPDFTKDFQYELEIVVRINKIGKHIEEKFAHKYYDEIGLGIDFTARDLQADCKKKGLPWECAKSFDNSAPISEFVPINELKDKDNIHFHLDVNGVNKQTGCSKEMIFSIDYLISYLSRFVTLKIGDLIFTGTPAGVGPVSINDRIEGYLEEKKMLDFKIK